MAVAASATVAPVAAAAAEANGAPGAPSEGARGHAVAGDDGLADTTTIRRKGSADEGRAALTEARALRDGAGCAAAVAKLDAVAVAYRGTQVAADAMWDEATCYAQMGEAQKAQQLYLALRSTGYRDRADAALASVDNNNPKNMGNQSAGNAAVASRAAAPAASPPAPPPDASASPSNARNAAGPANAGRAAPQAGKGGGPRRPGPLLPSGPHEGQLQGHGVLILARGRNPWGARVASPGCVGP